MTAANRDKISRRVALTGAGALGMGFLAACSGLGSSDHSSDSMSAVEKLPGPQRIRAEAKSMEPATYVKTYTVDASGADGAHRTFAEAYAAIATDRQNRIGVSAPSESNPWDWRLIRVAPGTYHECIKGVPPHTAIVGQGKRPEDVHVWWDQPDNTFESTGRSTYVRNIHLDHQGDQPDTHAMRDSGAAGDIGMKAQQRRTVVYENVRFTSLRTGSLGKCTNDMAPASGVSLTFRSCIFDGPGQPQSVNLVTNQGDGTATSTFAFIDCTVISNHDQHPSKKWEESGEVSAAPFGAPDFSHGRGDHVLWMDGHWDVGPTHGVQGLLVFPYIADAGQTRNARPRASTKYVLINPGEVKGMPTVKTDKVLPPVHEVPVELHLPFEGVAPQERAFFGAKPPAKGATLTATGADAGMMQVKAGDVYWVAVDLVGTTLFPRSVMVGGRKRDAVMGTMLALDDDGKPQTNGNGQTTGTSTPKDPHSAQPQPRWFFPGQGPVWVGVAFSADVEVPAIKSTSGKAYRSNGAQNGAVPAPTGLQPLPGGTPVPAVHLKNQLPSTMT